MFLSSIVRGLLLAYCMLCYLLLHEVTVCVWIFAFVIFSCMYMFEL